MPLLLTDHSNCDHCSLGFKVKKYIWEMWDSSLTCATALKGVLRGAADSCSRTGFERINLCLGRSCLLRPVIPVSWSSHSPRFHCRPPVWLHKLPLVLKQRDKHSQLFLNDSCLHFTAEDVCSFWTIITLTFTLPHILNLSHCIGWLAFWLIISK